MNTKQKQPLQTSKEVSQETNTLIAGLKPFPPGKLSIFDKMLTTESGPKYLEVLLNATDV